MKKIFSVMMLLATCVFGLAAQTLNADAYGVDMIMPDGVTATIAFYKKWGPANEDIKAVQPKDKKPMIGTTMTKAKIESDIGYFRETYKADGAIATLNSSRKMNIRPIEEIFYGLGLGGIEFRGYRIRYENGGLDMEYIIDSNGNYRKYDPFLNYPIVKETIVPQKVKDAVAKMFNP